ncbi:nuclear transport factor 2 family protein [Gymnodinialimonas sp. 2305UL16-5]|uniref:YybH family protein n=1 Tax=Gymnodinialimonas mytili TaxID=3126503 RepID=UPI0030A3F7E5
MIENEEEMNAARATLKAWLEAFNGKDLDGLFDLYTEDSVYANAKAPLKLGLEQVKPWYAGSIPNLKGRLLHKEEAAWQSGNLAGILGCYYFEPPADEAATGKEGSTGRIFLLFRKEGDAWRMAFDMDNAPEDVSTDWFK